MAKTPVKKKPRPAISAPMSDKRAAEAIASLKLQAAAKKKKSKGAAPKAKPKAKPKRKYGY
tara:strand:- start:2017 stop:2199 length:183 start_codon:yes stop_codon:yes gene_type:complete